MIQNQDDVKYIEEEEEYPLSTLLANIGGAMALWIGLTLMVVVEFIEFLCDLIMLCVRKSGCNILTRKTKKKDQSFRTEAASTMEKPHISTKL